MTKDFRERDLIRIENLQQFDGTTAVVATSYLPPEEIEYERWRASRCSYRVTGGGMLSHTFRGSNIWNLLGLENDRDAFVRYRAIRNAERSYL
jgi:hypothetical protein